MTWDETIAAVAAAQEACDQQIHAVIQGDAAGVWAATNAVQRQWHALHNVRVDGWGPHETAQLVARLRAWRAQLEMLQDLLRWRLGAPDRRDGGRMLKEA